MKRILLIMLAWFWFISAVMTMGFEFIGTVNHTMEFDALLGIFLCIYYSACLTFWTIIMFKCRGWYKL